jgi:glutamine amidotransferase
MCELMALSFARPVSADFSIRAFAARDQENADGWGLAWYPDRSLVLVKEPLRWSSSEYTRFLESYPRLRARIYIAHVRHGTTGGHPTHADTHPFARELGGREWCFAHNGTLLGCERLPLGRFHPIGRTDSEHVYCHLLDEVSRRPNRLETTPEWKWLHDKLADLNRLGKLNALLTDGRRLFCYHDAAGYKGLNFRPVHLHDRETRHFEDPTMQVDLRGPTAVNRGVAVATCPLTATGWRTFQPGELLVMEEGCVRFSSHRPADDPVFTSGEGSQ